MIVRHILILCFAQLLTLFYIIVMTVRLTPLVRGCHLYAEKWIMKYSRMKSGIDLFPFALNIPLGS